MNLSDLGMVRLVVYKNGAQIPMVVPDDISNEELARLIKVALTTPQGNGHISVSLRKGV